MKLNWQVMALTFVIGSGIIFAMPYADAAGAIEGEFKLGEVLDESIGWFIVVGLGVSAVGYNTADPQVLGHFSEVGILVLLFMAGLEVEIHAFLVQWRTVTIVGLGQIIFSTGLNALLATVVLPAVGQTANTTAAIYFGLAMTFSSTILVLGYLKKSKSMKPLP